MPLLTETPCDHEHDEKLAELPDERPEESPPEVDDTQSDDEHESHSLITGAEELRGTRLIEIHDIKAPTGFRRINKQNLESLKESINADGLLQPIGVRVDPDRRGRFLLVYGRHRLEAVRELGWKTIETMVLDIDAETAEMAMHAENLYRAPLRQPDRLVALKAWNDAYRARFPEVHGKRAGGEGKKRKDRAANASADSAPASETPVDEAPPTFTELAADQLGVSQRVVQKHLKVANTLSIDDLRFLDEHGVGKTETERIAALPDEEARQHALFLIGSGTPPKEAIARAALPKNATVVTVGDPADRGRGEADLSDEEWLQTYCGEVLARLKDTEAYKRDAILYRRTVEIRQKLRTASKKPLAQSKVQITGPFYRLFAKFVNIDHPSGWLPCGPCGGSGMDRNLAKCGNCWGNGFALRTAASGPR